MFFRKPKVQNLSEWLEAATRKIAPPARERIRLEIEAHYAESVATHLAGGLSENDAQMAALAELGDVRHAARRFKRQYLTTWQAQNLEASDKNSTNLIYLGVFYLMFFMTLDKYSLRSSSSSAARLAFEFLFQVALPTTAFYLARRKTGYPDGWLPLLIRCCNAHALGYLSFLAFGFPPSVDLPNAGLPMAKYEYWLTGAVQLFFVVRLFLALRLARKLHDLQNYPERPVSS
jgi:hypothetical protein